MARKIVVAIHSRLGSTTRATLKEVNKTWQLSCKIFDIAESLKVTGVLKDVDSDEIALVSTLMGLEDDVQLDVVLGSQTYFSVLKLKKFIQDGKSDWRTEVSPEEAKIGGKPFTEWISETVTAHKEALKSSFDRIQLQNARELIYPRIFALDGEGKVGRTKDGNYKLGLVDSESVKLVNGVDRAQDVKCFIPVNGEYKVHRNYQDNNPDSGRITSVTISIDFGNMELTKALKPYFWKYKVFDRACAALRDPLSDIDPQALEEIEDEKATFEL